MLENKVIRSILYDLLVLVQLDGILSMEASLSITRIL